MLLREGWSVGALRKLAREEAAAEEAGELLGVGGATRMSANAKGKLGDAKK